MSVDLLLDRKALESSYRRYRTLYDHAIRTLHRNLRAMLNKYYINATIKYRIKSFESYFEKLLRLQNGQRSSILLNDLIGLRIVCPFLEDIEVTEKLLSQHFTVIEVERKALRRSFREFGYDSTHILIELPVEMLPHTMPNSGRVCEIQLRTILQEAWAEVEHELIYKAGFSILNESIKRKLASLNANLALSDIIFQELRDYQKEIIRQDEKRRETLQEKVQSTEEISLLKSVETPVVTPKAPIIPPNSALEKLLLEALEMHSNGYFDQAIAIYHQIMSQRISKKLKSIVSNHRGMAYFVKSDYNNALQDFNVAIQNDRANYRAFINRGLVYRMLHRYHEALQDFDRSLQINALQVDGYYSRALVNFDLHNFAAAIEDCEKVLNINPDYSPVHHFKRIIAAKMLLKNPSQPKGQYRKSVDQP